jgi:hypothetical protein
MELVEIFTHTKPISDDLDDPTHSLIITLIILKRKNSATYLAPAYKLILLLTKKRRA